MEQHFYYSSGGHKNEKNLGVVARLDGGIQTVLKVMESAWEGRKMDVLERAAQMLFLFAKTSDNNYALLARLDGIRILLTIFGSAVASSGVEEAQTPLPSGKTLCICMQCLTGCAKIEKLSLSIGRNGGLELWDPDTLQMPTNKTRRGKLKFGFKSETHLYELSL